MSRLGGLASQLCPIFAVTELCQPDVRCPVYLVTGTRLSNDGGCNWTLLGGGQLTRLSVAEESIDHSTHTS